MLFDLLPMGVEERVSLSISWCVLFLTADESVFAVWQNLHDNIQYIQDYTSTTWCWSDLNFLIMCLSDLTLRQQSKLYDSTSNNGAHTLNADWVRLHLSVTAGRMKNIHRWIPNTRVTYMEEKTKEGIKKWRWKNPKLFWNQKCQLEERCMKKNI